jgi:hypothetical protein
VEGYPNTQAAQRTQNPEQDPARETEREPEQEWDLFRQNRIQSTSIVLLQPHFPLCPASGLNRAFLRSLPQLVAMLQVDNSCVEEAR